MLMLKQTGKELVWYRCQSVTVSLFVFCKLILTLEAVSKVSVSEHPGVEVQAVPLVWAEERLSGNGQVPQRERRVGRVGSRIREHHVRVHAPVQRPGRVLKAAAERSRMHRFGVAQSRGPNRFISSAGGVGVFSDQRFNRKTLFVLEHYWHWNDRFRIKTNSPSAFPIQTNQFWGKKYLKIKIKIKNSPIKFPQNGFWK